MLGLKHGKVKLYDHEKEWEENAERTICRLRNIFGNMAVDIQHVGSTSISSIKAKPIIDIAVGVKRFNDVISLVNKLKTAGFYYRPHTGLYEQMLFASGSYYDGTGDLQTHFVHTVIYGGEVWQNYVLFRDYLNEHTEVAKEYENLKLSLVKTIPQGDTRTAYIEGKHDFITRVIEEAKKG